MARISTQVAGKPWKCRKGCEIKVGDSYYRAKPYRSAAVIGCMQHPIKGFELSSALTAEVEAEVDSAETTISGAGSIEDIAQALRDVAASAEDVAGQYNDGADSQEEHFPGSSTAEESREKAESLEEFKQTCESAADEIDGLNEEFEQLEGEKGTLIEAIGALREAQEAPSTGVEVSLSQAIMEHHASHADLDDKQTRLEIVANRQDELLGEAREKASDALGEYSL